MELWQILIILMVLAVIIGNLMLLKHSAKIGFKVPKKETGNEQKKTNNDF